MTNDYRVETLFNELYKISAVKSAIEASENTIKKLGLDEDSRKTVVVEAYEVIKRVLF